MRRASLCRPACGRLIATLIAAATAAPGARAEAADELPPGQIAAAAQPAQVAADPAPPRVRTSAAPAQVAGEPNLTVVALGGRAGGGLVFLPGLPVGGLGRLGIDITISPLGPGSGPCFGVTEQIEISRAADASDFGIAGELFFGYRALPLVAAIGLGLNVITLDWEGDELGFGIYSPRAGARLGLQLGRFYALAEAGVQYRWRWTLDDPTIAQLGLTLGYVLVPDLSEVTR